MGWKQPESDNKFHLRFSKNELFHPISGSYGTVSGIGSDGRSISCGNLSCAVNQGVKEISITGAVSNHTDTIELLDQSNNLLICGIDATIINVTVTLTIKVSNGLGHIMFQNVKLINAVVTMVNVKVEFINCTLQDSSLEDSNRNTHVHITLYKTTILCSNNVYENSGVALRFRSIVKFLISETTIYNCRLYVYVTDLSLFISNSSVYNSPMDINVRSYLRVPTLIKLQDTVIQGNGENEGLGVTIDSYNPYIIVKDCTFQSVPLEIISRAHHFSQYLFSVLISDSTFLNSTKAGNGGALLIVSEVEGSRTSLYRCNFLENEGHRGGAVFIEASSLDLTIHASNFTNNLATHAGMAFFANKGVSLTMDNSHFYNNIEMPSPIFTSFGKVISFTGSIQINNERADIYEKDINLLYIQIVEIQFDVQIQCPLWHKHAVRYKVALDPSSKSQSNQSLNNLVYDCVTCAENYYIPSNKPVTLAYYSNITDAKPRSSSSDVCISCPYGAACSGNNIVPRPNYWGYWHEEELAFQQCPAGYCCSGTDNAPCTSYKSCAGNRTGPLCGRCQDGFSIAILSGECTSDSQCGQDHWFLLFAVLAAMTYAMWYTLKDDIFQFFIKHFKQLFGRSSNDKKSDNVPKDFVKQYEIKSYENRDNVPTLKVAWGTEEKTSDSIIHKPDKIDPAEENPLDNHSATINVKSENQDLKPREIESGVDKGYFGIITYFVQISAVMKIHIEFDEVNNEKSFLDSITENVMSFLNVDISKLSVTACPIVGLSTLGQLTYQLIFLTGIYLSWFVVFVATFFITYSLKNKERSVESQANFPTRIGYFKLKLTKGIIEIIKYTYAVACQIIFMSLTCIKLGHQYVWWYDGSKVCLEDWQIFMVMLAIFYAIPLPLSMYTGMKMLKLNQITAGKFIVCCLCPPITLYFTFFNNHTKTRTKADRIEHLALSAEATEIISVLQGPYREDKKHMTLYWEAMVSIRRLLISAMMLVGYASIRMMILTALCNIFLCQHIYMVPFQVRTSNNVETLSLLFLCLVSVSNLLKACLTDSGVVPSGPPVGFFKSLQFIESILVVALIVFVIYIEVRKIKSRK